MSGLMGEDLGRRRVGSPRTARRRDARGRSEGDATRMTGRTGQRGGRAGQQRDLATRAHGARDDDLRPRWQRWLVPICGKRMIFQESQRRPLEVPTTQPGARRARGHGRRRGHATPRVVARALQTEARVLVIGRRRWRRSHGGTSPAGGIRTRTSPRASPGTTLVSAEHWGQARGSQGATFRRQARVRSTRRRRRDDRAGNRTEDDGTSRTPLADAHPRGDVPPKPRRRRPERARDVERVARVRPARQLWTRAHRRVGRRRARRRRRHGPERRRPTGATR